MNIPTNTYVQIAVAGELIYEGLRMILRDAPKPGEYRVIEDLGKRITLQPRRGGPLVTTYKI